MEEEETKAEAFRRLAQPRVSSVLDRIRVLGNLSSRASYEYTDAQVMRMFTAIRKELDLVETKFHQVTEPKKFTFDE